MSSSAQCVSGASRRATDQHRPRDLSIDALRATAMMMVLAAHCVAPYLVSAPHFAQQTQQAWISAVPIQDAHRSAWMDAIFSLVDASVMAMWFLLSGLFTYRQLSSKGAVRFLRDRLVRLGAPLLLMALVLMPIAYYAAWSLEFPTGSVRQFWLVWIQHRCPVGPGWFLLLLLLFDFFTAIIFALAGGLLERLKPAARAAGRMPVRVALALLVIGFALHLPLFLRYQEMWLPIPGFPFSIQRARLPFYALWMASGIVVGSVGLNEGLLARDGLLARHWRWWVLAGLLAGGLRTLLDPTPYQEPSQTPGRLVLHSALWVLANTGLCFGVLAFFRGYVQNRFGRLAALAKYTLTIYICHYIFVLWTERSLLPLFMPAPAKAALSFAATLVLSLGTAALVHWLFDRLRRRPSSSGGNGQAPAAWEQAKSA